MNKVIIIGDSHHNTLGVVRSFGVNGIKPNGIIISPGKKKEFVSKSKYWDSVIIVGDEKEALFVLGNQFSQQVEKPVVILTSDHIAELIDLNYDSLSASFILPSFNCEQGKISELMNKKRQEEFARNNNIPVLDSVLIDLSSGQIDYGELDFPVIIKPVASNDGLKTDISICETIEDYKKAIDSIILKGYSRMLLQRYLKSIEEFVLSGSIEPNTNLISFVVVKRIRQWPLMIGTGSFSEFVKSDIVNKFAYDVLQILANNGYSGPIDIEFFKDENGHFYLNEFNWRVSGRNFVSLYTNVHSTYLWYLAVTGQNTELYKSVYRDSGFNMNEATDVRHVLSREITFREWIKDVKKTKSFSLWYKNDLRPSFARYWQLVFKYFRRKRNVR